MQTGKTLLKHYLQAQREAVLWKLSGLDEHDVRWPLTPTGTNLLGLVKHLAGVESEYLGSVFGRPFPESLPWTTEEAEDNSDMWATADEARDEIVALYRRVWAHSDETIDSLDLDAAGVVPWWAPDQNVTLQQVIVHLTAETARHAGHADIVRESLDGMAGLRAGTSNLPTGDEQWWNDYRTRLEAVAESFTRA